MRPKVLQEALFLGSKSRARNGRRRGGSGRPVQRPHPLGAKSSAAYPATPAPPDRHSLQQDRGRGGEAVN